MVRVAIRTVSDARLDAATGTPANIASAPAATQIVNSLRMGSNLLRLPWLGACLPGGAVPNPVPPVDKGRMIVRYDDHEEVIEAVDALKAGLRHGA
jgi:hypothetical protein